MAADYPNHNSSHTNDTIETKKDLLIINNADKHKLVAMANKNILLLDRLKISEASRKSLQSSMATQQKQFQQTKEKTAENLHRVQLGIAEYRSEIKQLNEKHASLTKQLDKTKQLASNATLTHNAEKKRTMESQKANEAELHKRIADFQRVESEMRGSFQTEFALLQQTVQQKENMIEKLSTTLTSAKNGKRVSESRLSDAKKKLIFKDEAFKKLKEEVSRRGAEIEELKEIIRAAKQQTTNKTELMIENLTKTQNDEIHQLKAQIRDITAEKEKADERNRKVASDCHALEKRLEKETGSVQAFFAKQLELSEQHNKDIAEKDKFIARLQSELEKRDCEHASIMSQSRTKIELCKDESKELTRQIRELEKEKQTLQTEFQTSHKLIAAMEKAADEQAQALEKLQMEFEIQKESAQKTINEIQSKLSKCESELSKSEEIVRLQKSTAAKDAAKFEVDSGKMTAACSKRKKQVEQLQSQLVGKDKELAKTDLRFEQANNQISKLEQWQHENSKLLTMLNEEKRALSVELTAVKQALTESELLASKYQSDLTASSGKIECFQAEVKSTNNIHMNDTKTISRLEHLNKDNLRQTEMLKEAIAMKDEQMVELTNEHDKQSKTLSKSKKEMEELSVKHRQLSNDMKDMLSKYKKLKTLSKSNLANCRHQIEHMKEKLQKYKAILNEIRYAKASYTEQKVLSAKARLDQEAAEEATRLQTIKLQQMRLAQFSP